MKHALVVSLLFTAFGCERQTPAPSARPSPSSSAADSAAPRSVQSPAPAIVRPVPLTDEPDWSEAYPTAALADGRILTLQLAAQSGEGAAATHAAFVLGRRLPADRVAAVLSVLPERLHASFARGAAGRTTSQQPESLPPAILTDLAHEHPDVALATWVFRSRRPTVGLADDRVRSLLASDRAEDQLTGARLLASPSVGVPYEFVEYLTPTALASAFRAAAVHGGTPAAWWHRWIDVVALRARANLRGWGNTWLALQEAAPRQEAEVRAALSAAVVLLQEARTGDSAVDSAFHCTNATAADVLAGHLGLVAACAADAHHWRSLVARANYLKAQSLEPQRAALLQALLHEAAGDVRVLEALPDAAVALLPAAGRPILQELATNRDPGVLAALLDALSLHVQHARALPPSVRETLVRAPFTLDEAPSLEARLNAVQLARALAMPSPATASNVRALQQANAPDAQVAPAPSTTSAQHETGDLIIITGVGRIVIRIDGSHAPQAADVVIRAARGGRYNGTSFHRVVPAFVAQGGDPRGDGYGGTASIVPTELSGARFDRGAVGIALAGLDTGGMQFFVVTADSPHLDARYPWIGSVVEGMDAVDELMIGDVMQRVEFVAR